MEKVAFSLKYGHLLKKRPASFEEEVLKMIFEATAFANMNEETLRQYNAIMTTELDIIARREYARKEGREEGLAEGLAKGLAEGRAEGHLEAIREVARNLLKMGCMPEMVSQATGLPEKDVRELESTSTL